MKNKFYKYLQLLQDNFTNEFEKIDTKAKFNEDIWIRPEGGGGKTRIIENGDVIEKGGVNISSVHGPLPESMQDYFKVENVDFYACGLSLVIHPNNPMAPTVHANWRYFEMYDKNGKIIDQWFGGGLDLTPYYFFKEDAEHFHKTCKDVCDLFNPEYYNKFKKKWPTLESFQSAKFEELMIMWQGLGYYRRAKNFFDASKILKNYDLKNYNELVKILYRW